MKSLQKLFELMLDYSCQPSQFACRNMVDKCPSQTSSQPSEAKMLLIWMQRWMQAWPTHRNSSTHACEATRRGARTEVFKVINNSLGVFQANSTCSRGCSGDLNVMEGTCSVLKSWVRKQSCMRERRTSAEEFWFYPSVPFPQIEGEDWKWVKCGCPDATYVLWMYASENTWLQVILEKILKKYSPSPEAAPPFHFSIFFLPESDIADFDGRSSLLYRFNQKLMSTFKDVVSLKFKSMQGDGVLFHGEGQRGDYITLELQKGKLSLHINLGKGN